ERVLCAEYDRVPGEPGADAPHRRAVFEDAFLRFSAHDLVAQPARLSRQSQAYRTADAGDGIAGDPAGAAHEQAASRTRQVPLFTAWNGDRRAVRSVER